MFPQNEIISAIHQVFKRSNDGHYRGYITITLSNETPGDGEIYLSGEMYISGEWRMFDNMLISESRLTKLLQLDWD
jgi:hypothetical protein